MSIDRKEDSPRIMSQVTLRDIGKKLGISHVAVSLALRNRGRISPERRETIKRVAKELGYRPDPSARSLNEHRLNRRKENIHAALAWVNFWPNPRKLRSYKEFDLYWQGAFEAADAGGFRLEEFDLNEDLTVPRLQRILLTRNIQGIIIPPQPLSADLSGLDWSRFSGVRITSSVASLQVYVVSPDKWYNGELAYARAKELGYKRIGFVSWATSGSLLPSGFIGGFLISQQNEPMETRVPPLYLNQHDLEEDAAQVRQWIDLYKPDAVLTDLAQMRELLRRLGLTPGKEIGLAAMSVLDGNSDAGIYQNPEFIGKAAAEIVISLINRRETGVSPDYRAAMVRGRWVDGPCMAPRLG